MTNWFAYKRLKKNPYIKKGTVIKKFINSTHYGGPWLIKEFTSDHLELQNLSDGTIIIIRNQDFVYFVPAFIEPDADRKLPIIQKTDSTSSTGGDPFTEVLPGSDKGHQYLSVPEEQLDPRSRYVPSICNFLPTQRGTLQKRPGFKFIDDGNFTDEYLEFYEWGDSTGTVRVTGVTTNECRNIFIFLLT